MQALAQPRGPEQGRRSDHRIRKGFVHLDLCEATGRNKPPDGSDWGKTRSLYEAVSAKAEIDEASFHDAVSRNLRFGRFLLLIVGHGIREEVESMTEFLQQYAGFHFTLAIRGAQALRRSEWRLHRPTSCSCENDEH